MTTVQQDAAAVRKLKLKASKLTKQAEDAARDFKAAQRRLYQRMIDEDMTSFKHGRVSYVTHSTEFGQIQDARAFERWCQENDQEDLFEPKPRKKLVNELVRECLRNSKPLPDGLGFYTNDYVSQTAPGETDDQA